MSVLQDFGCKRSPGGCCLLAAHLVIHSWRAVTKRKESLTLLWAHEFTWGWGGCPCLGNTAYVQLTNSPVRRSPPQYSNNAHYTCTQTLQKTSMLNMIKYGLQNRYSNLLEQKQNVTDVYSCIAVHKCLFAHASAAHLKWLTVSQKQIGSLPVSAPEQVVATSEFTDINQKELRIVCIPSVHVFLISCQQWNSVFSDALAPINQWQAVWLQNIILAQ